MHITGDIAESDSLEDHLLILDHLRIPIYFILGNHDYYKGSLHEVRGRMRNMTNSESNNLFWLPEKGVVQLTENSALVGVDGWYDGRYGDAANSTVYMSDWNIIAELYKSGDADSRIALLREWADKEAAVLEELLRKALENFTEVIVLTHVPPWDRAATYQGKMSDRNWLPWFSSKATGDVIEQCSRKHQNKKIMVLCGHSHGSSEVQITDDIKVVTGAAKYRFPSVAGIFEV